MTITVFLFSLGLPIALTLASMAYLRPILRNVLAEICGTTERAEFWIRCATLLSLFGALILVLAFGAGDQSNLIDTLRWTLVLTLAGGFAGIAWVARTIWNSLTNCPQTRARLFSQERVDAALAGTAPNR